MNIISKNAEIHEESNVIIAIYNAKGIRSLKKELKMLAQVRPHRTILLEDWNARLGTLGSKVGPEATEAPGTTSSKKKKGRG